MKKKEEKVYDLEIDLKDWEHISEEFFNELTDNKGEDKSEAKKNEQ